MKRVLLLGDSIREYCQLEVEKKLGEDYAVYYPWENGRFSAYTLNSLRYWFDMIPADKIDVIHWNNGLWDAGRINGEDRCFTDLNVYIDNMVRIYEVLRKRTHAKIILATTTPTRKEKENHPVSRHFVTDIRAYNDALLNALGKKVDDVDDLFSLIMPEREKLISDDFIHPNPMGVDLLFSTISFA